MAHDQKTPDDTGEPGVIGDLFQTRYREVTLSAIIFAVIIGVIMNAAITYSGLKIGFTIGGSAIAAVLGFGVLHGVLRQGTILETNVAQTIASAINTSNSGVIFTVPVLFLIGYQLTITGSDFWLITLACVAGAMLGTAFIVPLRKQMLDIERLRFPSPTAVAAILKSPGAGPAKALVLLIGIVLGALIYLPTGLPAMQTPAALTDLDTLFDDGRISHAQREQTRTIQGWIDDEAAPDDVIKRGQWINRRNEARAELERARENPNLDLASFEVRVTEADGEVAALAEKMPQYNDELCRLAYLASKDEGEWAALRNRSTGWATVSLPGYSNLNWLMPDEVLDGAEPRDLDGDGTPDTVLTVRVDRDQDGRPDPILTDSSIDVGRLVGLPDTIQLIFAIAPFALGAGYLTGTAGLFVLAGGILAFFLLNPIAFGLGWMPETIRPDQAPGYGFGAFNRPLGIGLLVGGAMMGVLFSLPAIREAVKSIAVASKLKGGGDELGLKTLGVTAVIGFVALFASAYVSTEKPLNETAQCPVTQLEILDNAPTASYQGYRISFHNDTAAATWTNEWSDDQRDAFLATMNAKPGLLAGVPSIGRALLIAIVGTLWIWFAGIIIAQCAGMTDWSPISGLALLTVVLIMLLAGTGAVVGAVLIGASLCVAITLAADMMGDLKTGYLVGAKPKRQQIVELGVVWIGPIVAMLTIVLIAGANEKLGGPAMGPGSPLQTSAPQAQALQSIITGMQGGEMPYALYGFGALLGGLLGLGSFSGLGVLIGLSMYLPFMYIATYGIGCLVNIAVVKIKGRAWAEDWGVPFAAGLIVGESILALIINFIVLATG